LGTLDSANGRATGVRKKTGPTKPADACGIAFVFDLDGTLVENVYQHVLAWREARDDLTRKGIQQFVADYKATFNSNNPPKKRMPMNFGGAVPRTGG
jgi:hypothetical protein